MWLVWAWLGIAESSAAALAGSVVLGLVIVAAVAWLLATAFEGNLRVHSMWLRSLLFVLLALLLIGIAVWLAGYRPAVTGWIAAKISNARAKAVNPRSLDWIYRGVLWSALGVTIAAVLPRLFVRSSRVLRDWRYWTACLLVVLIGGYLPWKVVTWVPAANTLAMQTVSMFVRFSLAYLVGVAALLLFASAVRRLASAPPAGFPNEPNSTA
jgi:hypothetical protein